MILVDSNVLVAATLLRREQHAASFALLARAEALRLATAAHCLNEVYSNLTRSGPPGHVPLTPAQALRAVEGLRARLILFDLDVARSGRALRLFAEIGGRGPLLYDFLIGRCAIEHGIGVLATWNTRHFRALFPDLDVATPTEILQRA